MNINKRVLVTGGSGFLGIHVILQLLEKDYTVNTTVRSAAKRDEVLAVLEELKVPNTDRLHFFEADLTDDAQWDAALQGCDYVLHTASPFPVAEPEDESELVVPAKEGTLRVLKAADRAGVKRVVVTSSFAAVGYGTKDRDHVFTEEDWTPVDIPLPAYIKSKTVAERAAWDYIGTEGSGMELTVINPVGIFGPVIGGITSSSLDIAISGIISGVTDQSPDFTMGVVDVRDVAGLHILAMEHPAAAGQRFIAAAEGVMSFYDVAALIRERRPEKAGRIAAMKPTPEVFYKAMSNHKAVSLLGWQPRSREEAILASVDSL